MQKQKKAWRCLREEKNKQTWSARSKCDDSWVFPEELGNGIWWIGMLELESLSRQGWGRGGLKKRTVFTGGSGCHYRSPGSHYSRSSQSLAGSLPRGHACPAAASPVSFQTDRFALGRCFLQCTTPPPGAWQSKESRAKLWLPSLNMHSFRWPAGGNYSDFVRRKNAPQSLYFVTSNNFPMLWSQLLVSSHTWIKW